MRKNTPGGDLDPDGGRWVCVDVEGDVQGFPGENQLGYGDTNRNGGVGSAA
ncbi:MAG: hypothetical protein ACRDTF_05080 [Pseudonocardiaceae bacterium]